VGGGWSVVRWDRDSGLVDMVVVVMGRVGSWYWIGSTCTEKMDRLK
jgi:hypothetical protein